MPVWRTGRRMQSGRILFLVTCRAFDGIHSLPVGAAPHLHGMRVAVVPLTWEVSLRMTIHAPRVMQDRNDILERGGSRLIPACCLSRGGDRKRPGQQAKTGCSPGSHVLLTARSAAFTRAGVKGRSRRRAALASKIAFPIAAGVTVIAVSPAPVAGTPSGATKTHSTGGIS